MQVTDNRPLHLPDFFPDGRFVPKERQGAWIMAKEQNALLGPQRPKGAGDLRDVRRAKLLPRRTFRSQRVRLIHGQRQER